MKLLVTSDWHVRSDIPRCRIDDFLDIQKKTLQEIADISKQYGAKIVIAGDIFHRPKPINPQYLEIMLYEIFKNCELFFIAGQHDLVGNNRKNIGKGSLGVITNYSNWNYIGNSEFGFLENYPIKFIGRDFGENSIFSEKESSLVCIGVIHKYVAEQLPFWMEGIGITSEEIFNIFSNFDIIISGDNHSSFSYTHENQILLNCGCITRQKIDERNYIPSIFLLEISETSSSKFPEILYEQIPLIDTFSDVFRETKINSIDNGKYDSVIELIESNVVTDWDFEENLEIYLKKNHIRGKVIEKINQIIEESRNEC